MLSSDKTLQIQLLGTFDVRNYGDLLFPLVAATRLAPYGIEVSAVSPTDVGTGWTPYQPTAFRNILNARRPVDGVLIGGGNIIHAGPANLRDYAIGDMGDWAYASLWMGATVAAAIRNVPVLWNAPGVPRQVPDSITRHVAFRQMLQAADYVSVRDAASASHLGEYPDVTIHVVPDTAADLARVWSVEQLADTFATLLQRKAILPGGRYFAVHAKARSVGNVSREALAGEIEAFAQRHALTPILIALGPCHEDDVYARQLSRHLRHPHVLMDDPLGVEEIAAVISQATAYVGSSLHGYITSAVYGVPSLLVAEPKLPKFPGFLKHIGRSEDLCDGWTEAFAQADSLMRRQAAQTYIPPEITAQLDAHWDRIATLYLKPPSSMVARTRFLRSFVQRSIESGGWSWALRNALE